MDTVGIFRVGAWADRASHCTTGRPVDSWLGGSIWEGAGCTDTDEGARASASDWQGASGQWETRCPLATPVPVSASR
jgi:hypothetical protein